MNEESYVGERTCASIAKEYEHLLYAARGEFGDEPDYLEKAKVLL